MLNLFLFLAIGYELQKLIQFEFFFKLKSLSINYLSNIKNKIKTQADSVLLKNLLIVAYADLAYSLVLLIGLFTINLYFILCIFLLSIIISIIFNVSENIIIRKISFIIDILLSIILLSLSIINSIHYHLDGIQLIKQLIWQLH